MANPPGIHQQEANQASSLFNAANFSNANPMPETFAAGMKHNPGISLVWSVEEQAKLEEGLTQYASEPNITRYAKIAMMLPNKTVRDVALRCRWMTKKEHSKRRKEDLARKNKEKRERVADPLVKPVPYVTQHNVSPYAPAMIPQSYDDGIPYKAVNGVTGELLERNTRFFEQIYDNIAACQVEKNIELLCQTRDNIMMIIKSFNDMPDIMKQMPELPVRMNDELADTILPRPSPFSN